MPNRTGNWEVRAIVDHPTDPTAVLVPLGNGLFSTIDRSDLGLVEGRNWYPTRHKRITYARANKTTTLPAALLHRVIFGGESIERVDHIDGDGLNNRRSNLRPATHVQNMRNQKLRSDSQTGVKGVRYVPRANHWVARISVAGKRVFLGCFASPEAAGAAYDAAAEQFFGEFARKNSGGVS